MTDPNPEDITPEAIADANSTAHHTGQMSDGDATITIAEIEGHPDAPGNKTPSAAEMAEMFRKLEQGGGSVVMTANPHRTECTRCGHGQSEHGDGGLSLACRYGGCPCQSYDAPMIPAEEAKRMADHVRNGGSQGMSTCRAFLPVKGASGQLGGIECSRCARTYAEHPIPLDMGGKGGATRFMVTVTRVQNPAGRAETLAFGFMVQGDRNPVCAFRVAAERATALYRALRVDTEQGAGDGMNAWVDEESFVQLPEDAEVAIPAVVIDTITGFGPKPTLVEGQGVILTRRYQGSVPGQPLVVADVVYDPTDPKAAEVQWPTVRKVQDVSTYSLVIEGNWRRYIPQNAAQSAADPRAFSEASARVDWRPND